MNLTNLPEDILRTFSGFKLNMVNRQFLKLNEKKEISFVDYNQRLTVELYMYCASIHFLNMSGIFIDTLSIFSMVNHEFIDIDEAFGSFSVSLTVWGWQQPQKS